MKHNKQELDAIIDDVTRRIRDEQIEPSVVDQVSDRIWARVSQEAAGASVNSHLESLNTMNAKNTTEHIRGCDDFQSLIPAYLDGQLSMARTLLLEDHSKECIPCRLELKAQRTGASVNAAAARPAGARRGRGSSYGT